jgi:uncharacterized protein
MSKKTVIIGATTNKSRYAYLAAERLKNAKHEFVPVGIKEGEVEGKPILNIKQHPPIEEVDTITMYLGPQNQPEYYDYLLSLKPKRIIFNPGTENPELEQKAKTAGIETIKACTLVMLGNGLY